jgi:hypothetical protein
MNTNERNAWSKDKLVTGYRNGVASYKAFHTLRPFSDLLCVPIWVLIIPDWSATALGLQQRNLVAKQEVGVLRHGADGFTSSPKEGALRIFIALKYRSPRTGLNPRTLGPIASTLTNIKQTREAKLKEMQNAKIICPSANSCRTNLTRLVEAPCGCETAHFKTPGLLHFMLLWVDRIHSSFRPCSVAPRGALWSRNYSE